MTVEEWLALPKDKIQRKRYGTSIGPMTLHLQRFRHYGSDETKVYLGVANIVNSEREKNFSFIENATSTGNLCKTVTWLKEKAMAHNWHGVVFMEVINPFLPCALKKRGFELLENYNDYYVWNL